MTTLPTNTETPDELDQLLADFFKSQLNQPWPDAPVPPSSATAEPSALAAARRDGSARSRFTLAASVVLVLGASLLLSNGYRPSVRSGVPAPNGGLKMLPDSGADGNTDPRLKTIEENKAKGNGGFKPEVKFD